MAQQGKKRIGRPVKAPTPGTRVALGLKVTPDIKRRLDQDARASGRTQSQQAEVMLERAYALQDGVGGPEMVRMTYLMASSFAIAGQRNAGGGAQWITDPLRYSDAVAGVLDALLIGFPEGEGRALAVEGLVGRLLSRVEQERLKKKERGE